MKRQTSTSRISACVCPRRISAIKKRRRYYDSFHVRSQRESKFGFRSSGRVEAKKMSKQERGRLYASRGRRSPGSPRSRLRLQRGSYGMGPAACG